MLTWPILDPTKKKGIFGRGGGPTQAVILASLLVDRSVGVGNCDSIGAGIRNLSQILSISSLSNFAIQGVKFLEVGFRAVLGVENFAKFLS